MSKSQFHSFLRTLRHSALFRSRPILFTSLVALLAVLFFSASFLLSAASRGASPKTASVSPFHALCRTLGLASDDELGLKSESDSVAIDEGERDPSRRIEKRTVRRGDSIYTILTSAGVTPAEVHQLTGQLKGDKAVKGLTAGKTYEIETDKKGKFIRFTWQSGSHAMLHLLRDDESGKLNLQKETIEYETRVATIDATLGASLDKELRIRNRSSLVPQLRKILSSKVDFKKDIHAGATCRILFQEQWSDNHFVGTGDILAVEIGANGKQFNAYRFSDAKGNTAYYDEKGRALMQGKTMFSQPCQYRRVSSGFGYRLNPVTRQREFHGGVDMVAPTGTPVKAVADGRIVFRGQESGTGNMITIAHAGGVHTMYMHMSRYASTCRYGKRVKQGELIGYVGSTGRSTGSHLDFRVIRNGHLQNPLAALKQKAERRSLTSAELRSFTARVQAYHGRFGAERPVMVADMDRQADPML
jgi:murein DD-endopeptidase MepM/ murein hydrolase activator NlpD